LLSLSLLMGYSFSNDSLSSHPILDLDQVGINLRFNQTDKNGNTILHLIALRQDPEQRKALWEAIEEDFVAFPNSGLTYYLIPNPYIKNNDGKTAGELFQETDHMQDNDMWISYIDCISRGYRTIISYISDNCTYNCNTNIYTVYWRGVERKCTHDEMKEFIGTLFFCTPVQLLKLTNTDRDNFSFAHQHIC